MKFGTNPSFKQTLIVENIDPTDLHALALRAGEKLGWELIEMTESLLVFTSKISLFSWSEKITLTIVGSELTITSACTSSQLTDWGKNKKNVTAFLAAFESMIASIASEDHELVKKNILAAIAEEEEFESEELAPEVRTIDFFVPGKLYTITPLLIYVNVLIFVLMLIGGANIMQPGNEVLLNWGANFRPSTLDGEWWRLFTCCFLHIGILHLLFNMYALFYVGILLEPLVGKTRFLLAYLLTGVISSMASLWWNEYTISAGASGAIFGMYGLFLALLTTNLIDKTTRRSMLTSIGVFVGYNLLFGMQEGIDNAAHIGGLLSGLLMGYVLVFSLRKPENKGLKMGTNVLLIVLSLAICVFWSSIINDDLVQYQKMMDEFALCEEKAIVYARMDEQTPVDKRIRELTQVSLPNWQKCVDLTKTASAMQLPPYFKERNQKVALYAQLRKRSFELYLKSEREQTAVYNVELDSLNREVEQVLEELKK